MSRETLARGLAVLALGLATSATPLMAPRHAAAQNENPAQQKPAPKDPFTRGMELFKAGRLNDALTAFREEERFNPRDAIVLSWIGFILFKQNKLDEAIRYLNRSVQLAPNNADTYNNLGNAYFAKGDTNAAIEAYRQAVNLLKDKPGNHADPYYNLGNALAKKGDLDGALAAFLQAGKHDPNDPLIQNNLGFVYERLHARDPGAHPIAPAVEHYQRAAEKRPNDARFQRNLGLAARKAEMGDLALKALARSAQLDPKDYNVQLALAEEYQQRKMMDQAILAYKAAAAIRPGEFVPAYNLGLLFALQAGDLPAGPQRKARFTAAISQLEQAVKLRPTDHRALSALGWTCFKADQLREAAAWYDKAILADPQVQATYVNHGLVLERLKQPLRAIERWKEALKLDPADAPTRSLLASAYLGQELYNEAVAELQQIVRLTPNDARAHNNLGFALEKVNKLDAAIAAYKEAIRLDSRLAIAHNNLGACYQRQGQKELARECYKRALQIDPGYQDAKKNLERLGGS